MTRESLTQEYVREFFDYNPHTGIITWKKSGGRRRPNQEAGYLTRLGYRSIGIKGIEYFGHRIAWLWMTGEWPKGEIDHKNHIRDDNRWENLRDVVKVENGRNLPRKKNNKSGVNGVFWSKTNRKWMAQIAPNGKALHLGCFEKIEDAIEVRQRANIKYGFHENHGVKNGSLSEA